MKPEIPMPTLPTYNKYVKHNNKYIYIYNHPLTVDNAYFTT